MSVFNQYYIAPPESIFDNDCIYNMFDLVFKKEIGREKLNAHFKYKGETYEYIKSHLTDYNLEDLVRILVLYHLGMRYQKANSVNFGFLTDNWQVPTPISGTQMLIYESHIEKVRTMYGILVQYIETIDPGLALKARDLASIFGIQFTAQLSPNSFVKPKMENMEDLNIHEKYLYPDTPVGKTVGDLKMHKMSENKISNKVSEDESNMQIDI